MLCWWPWSSPAITAGGPLQWLFLPWWLLPCLGTGKGNTVLFDTFSAGLLSPWLLLGLLRTARGEATLLCATYAGTLERLSALRRLSARLRHRGANGAATLWDTIQSTGPLHWLPGWLQAWVGAC